MSISYQLGVEYVYMGQFVKIVDMQGKKPHRLFIVEDRFCEQGEVWEDSGNLTEKPPRKPRKPGKPGSAACRQEFVPKADMDAAVKKCLEMGAENIRLAEVADQAVQDLATADQVIRDLTMLVERLCRQLPADNDMKTKALDYLARKREAGVIRKPNILRTKPLRPSGNSDVKSGADTP